MNQFSDRFGYAMECIPSTSFSLSLDPTMDPCSLRCHECGEMKSSAKMLFYHLFEHHDYDKTRIASIKQLRKTRSTHTKALRKAKQLHVCDICGTPFLSRSGLSKHNERMHDMTSVAAARIPCPISSCTGRFYTYMELATHADFEHRDEAFDRNSFRVYKQQFADIFALQEWRAEKEYETGSKFVMRSSEKKFTYGKRVVMWNCAKGYSRRKEIAYKPCPAFIRICERHCGTFEVVACFGHLGHPHTSVNPTTECRFRSEAAEGAEEIEAVRELLEVTDEFLTCDEDTTYRTLDEEWSQKSK
ncbi:hypothetical protein RB195_000165 [Necator americanus]|uniref:C2H2-type domain-containing protein n=1 Tax=Necator americanus TaxID=51031 RepID=A0ABR1D9G0_NECAM